MTIVVKVNAGKNATIHKTTEMRMETYCGDAKRNLRQHLIGVR
jgi:hypothetical protein